MRVSLWTRSLVVLALLSPFAGAPARGAEPRPRIIDPGFHYHAAMVNLWGRFTMRLAEAEALPLHYSNTAQFALDGLQSLDERIDDANAGVTADTLRLAADLSAARAAARRLLAAASGLEARVDQAMAGSAWPGGSAAALNAALMRAERGLLGPGRPGRPWFRHELFAPSLNTGYAPVPLPRLGQPLLDKDRKALAAGRGPDRGSARTHRGGPRERGEVARRGSEPALYVNVVRRAAFGRARLARRAGAPITVGVASHAAEDR